MKKMILSLAVVTAVSLVGCKNTNNNQNTNQQNIETQEVSNQAVVYNVATAESTIEWVGAKPAGKHNGTLSLSEGKVTIDGGKLVSGSFTLDMNSITVLDLTGDEKGYLEGHLKGTAKPEDADHFFNVTKYPTGTFELKSFDGTNVYGDLTVKGITKPVNFPATVTVTDNEVTLTSNTFTINRVDFGINYASKSIFDNLKDKFVNDDIELAVKVKATK